MKKHTFRYLLAALLLAVVFSSCATKKKYGCPGHINIGQVFGF